MPKVVHCECGIRISGETDDELVETLESHIAEFHPELVGNMDREQMLAMSEEQ